MPTIGKLLCAACLTALSASPARASIETFSVEGDAASAVFALPGGVGVELTVSFESVVGLDAGSLGLSAQLVDPLSPALLGALPDPLEIALPSGFPVLLTIAAPAAGALSFEGVVEIELYTRNLDYSSGSTLRLFSRSNGEPFRDITDAVSGGSYRVRGSSGQFSDFLVVADSRPVHEIVETKFTRLHAILSAHAQAIDPDVANDLGVRIAGAYAYWQAGDPGAAIEQLRLLGDAVETAAAAGRIPDVWRSARDVDNVAGGLRAEAQTLRFTLGLALAGTP